MSDHYDPEVARRAFGTALARARAELGWTQERLGNAVGLSQQAVGGWESGRKEPDPRTAIRIEHALEVRPGDLTKHLGFLPLAAAGEIIEHTVIDAILEDPDLTDGQRSSLLATYREFTRR